MLKFLDGRKSSKKLRTQIQNRHIDDIFGNSYESPPEFQMKHSLIAKRSYNNPFLSSSKRDSRKNKINFKINLFSNEQNQSIIYRQDTQGVNNSQVSPLHAQQHEEDGQQANLNKSAEKLNKSDSQETFFRIKKGPFTDFIDRNSHYRSIGPLMGNERRIQSYLEDGLRVKKRKFAGQQTSLRAPEKESFTNKKAKKQKKSNQNKWSQMKLGSSFDETKRSGFRDSCSGFTKVFRTKVERQKAYERALRELNRPLDGAYSFHLPKLQYIIDLYGKASPIIRKSIGGKSEVEKGEF